MKSQILLDENGRAFKISKHSDLAPLVIAAYARRLNAQRLGGWVCDILGEHWNPNSEIIFMSARQISGDWGDLLGAMLAYYAKRRAWIPDMPRGG